MAYKGWRNLERSKPPINELVELQHMITGIGAPEREGWVSVGRMRENVFRNEEQRLREKALSLTHIGKEIMLNPMQRRLDSRTIILERKK